MTVKLLATRDERARALVEDVVAQELASTSPRSVAVSLRPNHSGEPSLYVYVLMSSEAEIPDDEQQDRLSRRLLTALQAADEDRFPYVFFGPRAASLGSPSKGEAT